MFNPLEMLPNFVLLLFSRKFSPLPRCSADAHIRTHTHTHTHFMYGFFFVGFVRLSQESSVTLKENPLAVIYNKPCMYFGDVKRERD